MAVPRWLLIALVAASACAEDLPMPDVPDPVGLGPRLALIDYLRNEMRVEPQADATLEQLVTLYWRSKGEAALAVARGETIDAMPETEADLQMRVDRLRRELQARYGYHAPAEFDEAQLIKELNRLRAQDEKEQLEKMGAVNRAEQAHARKEEHEKIAAENSATAVAPRGGDEDWRNQLQAAWRRLEALPTWWDAKWLGKGEPAEDQSGRVKVKRGNGMFDYLAEIPNTNDDIAEAWLLRKDRDEDTDMVSARWQPMSWIAEESVWIPDQPEPYRWSREEGYGKEWFSALLSKPGHGEDWNSAWYVAYGQWERAEARKKLHNDAAGLDEARAAVASVLAKAAAELDSGDLMPICQDLHDFGGALSDYGRFAMELSAREAAEKDLEEWKQRTEAMMRRCKNRRAMMRDVMDRVFGK